MAYKVTTAGVSTVNVVTCGRVANACNSAWARGEVRVSSTANVGAGSAASKATDTAAGEVRTTTTTEMRATATTAAEMRATTTAGVSPTSAATATVTFGAGDHWGPGDDRYSGQRTEGPGQNSCMFCHHGLHSVAGRQWSPRGIRTLQ